MPVTTNYCKADIRFICTTHDQPECMYFRKDPLIRSNSCCEFGLPDRICTSTKARRGAIKSYIYLKLRGRYDKKNKA